MLAFLGIVYGIPLLVSLTNAFLMRRPSGAASVCFEVMIPARNEAENLPHVVGPLLASGVQVTVFDDDSSDGTGEVAERLGARVLRSHESLPAGWVGKTWACHQLAQAATSSWVVFLDADTRPPVDFAERLSAELQKLPPSIGTVSGFPRLMPGSGVEPAYLAWVPWILLATNPFGLVTRTGRGHNRFMNGQFGAWRLEALRDVEPYRQVRGDVLEDVKIGRLLCRLGRSVEVWDLSSIIDVHMYADLRAAFSGMCKNSCEVAPGPIGTAMFASVFLLFGWGWTLGGSLWWVFLLALIVSKLLTDRVAKMPLWTAPLLPLTCTAAAATILTSGWLKSRGRIEWKGRVYGDPVKDVTRP